MKLFENFAEAGGPLEFLFRFGHILAGITWIGLLYFFNFVQVPMFAKLSDGARSEALRNLTFRALWWFRFAALATFLFGVAIVGLKDQETYFQGPGGASIGTGMLFGITMFVNVWGIIWRNQKIVIASAQAVADGGQANPDAATCAKKAARASRTNVVMSVPMLFFMVFTSHYSYVFDPTAGTAIYWILVVALWGFLEANAIGLVGGLDSPFSKLALDDHKKTIIAGFAVLAVIYFIGWELLIG